MKPSAKALLALSFLVGVGGSVFAVRGVGAQGSYTPPLSSVSINGTVQTELGASSIAALNEPTCTLGPPYRATDLGTTPASMPPTVLETRNRVLVTNLDSSKELWCCLNCTPSDSQASVMLPGAFKEYAARSTDTLNCRCSSGTCSLNVEEYTCTQ